MNFILSIILTFSCGCTQYVKTIIAYIIIYGLYYYYILCVYEMKIRVGKRERLWIKRNIRLFTIYFG